MRQFLITNDDGIHSEGLLRLVQTASKFGRVIVAAPREQCSAMSHRITIHDGLLAERTDYPAENVEAWCINGTPADCVRLGTQGLTESRPDIVLSGINYGYNCGGDLQYSGTMAAALEGAHRGFHSIAFSEGAGASHEVSDKYLEELLLELIERPLPYDCVWNVNFPECPLADFKGILRSRKIDRGAFYADHFTAERQSEKSVFFRLDGPYAPSPEKGTDVEACVNGYISVGIVSNIGQSVSDCEASNEKI